MSPSPTAALRIGEVARRTGVTVPTLRAWERRYGLLEPERTEGGHRLYSDRDVDRVDAVVALTEQGWSVGAAARQVTEAVATEATVPVDGAVPELDRRLREAFDDFDARTAEGLLDDLLARLDPVAALDEVLLPILRWVGEGWEDDERNIAREHFTSNVIRGRLTRLLRASTGLPGRVAIAAAPETDEHDLGLLGASVALTADGWRVHFLGARTPAGALAMSVRSLSPSLVVLGSVERHHVEALFGDPPDLDATPVLLGGAGFVAGDAARFERAAVHDGGLRDLTATVRTLLDGDGTT